MNENISFMASRVPWSYPYPQNSSGRLYSCMTISVHTLSVTSRTAIGKTHDLRARSSQKSRLIADSDLAQLFCWSWNFASTEEERHCKYD